MHRTTRGQLRGSGALDREGFRLAIFGAERPTGDRGGYLENAWAASGNSGETAPARESVSGRGEGRAPTGAGLLSGSVFSGIVPGAARQVAVALHVRTGLPQPAPDPRVHPAADEILVLRPDRVPDGRRDLPVRPPLRAPLQRGQQFSIPVPRTRPDRGAGSPDQTSSIRRTVRTNSSPPSSGKGRAAESRTWTAAPGRSTFKTSAPSASRRPRSEAPPAAASALSGAASRATLASAIDSAPRTARWGRSLQRGLPRPAGPVEGGKVHRRLEPHRKGRRLRQAGERQPALPCPAVARARPDEAPGADRVPLDRLHATPSSASPTGPGRRVPVRILRGHRLRSRQTAPPDAARARCTSRRSFERIWLSECQSASTCSRP